MKSDAGVLNMQRRERADFYALEARRLGYPARSVFKLREIQRKWKLLKGPVLDVGAAPGGWTLFALRTLGFGARVVAIDLEDLDVKAPPGCEISFLRGDIFSREGLRFVEQEGPYGCMLSDAAPATIGNRVVDTSRSYNLALQVLCIAETNLMAGGNLALKLFQGGDEEEIRDRMRVVFERVRLFRPKAVRQNSMEVYIIGMGRRP